MSGAEHTVGVIPPPPAEPAFSQRDRFHPSVLPRHDKPPRNRVNRTAGAIPGKGLLLPQRFGNRSLCEHADEIRAIRG